MTPGEAFVLVVLGAAGVLDLVYREVDPEVWLVSLPPAVALGAVSVVDAGYLGGMWWAPYVLGLVPVVLLAGLYVSGLVGGADLGALALVAVGVPVIEGSILPPVYLAVVYGAPVAAGYYVYSLARVCGLRCVARGRAVLDAGRLLELKWWHPRGLGEPVVEAHEALASAGVWGRVEASPLLPMVFVVWVGFVAALVVGDDPLVAVLGLGG